MGKRRRFATVLVTFVVFLSLLHLSLHFIAFGTGVRGVAEQGLSGFAVGSYDVGKEIKNFSPVDAPLSRMFLYAEWGLIAAILIFSFLHKFMISRKDKEHFEEHVSKRSGGTDIDRLYDLLKSRKRLGLSSIRTIFNADKPVALQWCATLEGAGLAQLDYPRFGEPELVYVDTTGKEVSDGQEKVFKAKISEQKSENKKSEKLTEKIGKGKPEKGRK